MQPLPVGAPVIVLGGGEHHGKYGGFIQEYILTDGTVMASVLLPDGSLIKVLPEHLFLNPGPPPGPPPPSAQEMAALKPYLKGSRSYKTLNRFSKYGGNKSKTRRRQRQRQNKRNRKNKYSRRRRSSKSRSK